jgi:hypothetical protein
MQNIMFKTLQIKSGFFSFAHPKNKVRNLGTINRMRYTLKILLAILLSFSFFSFAPPEVDTTAKMRAMYVYQFTKYIEWPASTKQGSFIVGVLGSTHVYQELLTSTANKKVGTQNLEVINYTNLSAVEKCQILLVSKENADNIKDIVNKTKSNHTLVVTEKAGMAKLGAAISFIVQENKQKFELSKQNAEKNELRISANLETLAIKVD